MLEKLVWVWFSGVFSVSKLHYGGGLGKLTTAEQDNSLYDWDEGG